MNTKTLFNSVKSKLLAAVWGASANKVFHSGSVLVSVAPDTTYLSNCVSPMAIIRPMDATMDPEADEEPDLILQRFSVRLVTVTPGDAVGENPIMGANIASGTKSEGKGVLDLEVELFRAIQLLEQDEGVQIVSRARSAMDATIDETLGYICWRDYQFEALISAYSANL